MKRYLLLLVLLLGCTASAEAQGIRHDNVAQQAKNVNGTLVAALLTTAQITVCTYSAGDYNASGIYIGALPCTGTVSLFVNQALTQALLNPIGTDARGNYFFWVAPGTYTITVTAPGVTGYGYSLSGSAGGGPGGSSAQIQYNSAGAFGGTSNGTFANATGIFTFTQLANGNNLFVHKRFTDTAPTGNFHNWQTAAGVDLAKLDVLGNFFGTDFRNISGTSFFSPSYVQVSCNTVLTPNCRTLAAGNNITLTDGGAGGSLTVAVSGPVVDTTSAQTITGTKTLDTDLPLKINRSIGFEITNETVTGTTSNRLAKLSTTNCPASTACALVAAITDTNGMVGIVRAGAGITGNSSVVTMGEVLCLTDNAATAGNYVQIGTVTAGACKDAGATFPAAGQVIGRFLTGGALGTNQAVLVFWPSR